MQTRLPRRAIGLVMAGIVVLQVGWLIAVPPYAQMDELDHAFRASAVAHGKVFQHIETKDGWGDLVQVPEAVVFAARYRCLRAGYYGEYNCIPATRPDGHGNVLAATGAARYNPTYYAIVGPVSLAFASGTRALIAMRLVSMVLCDLVLLWALSIAIRHGRSLYPTVGLICAAMPVALCAWSTVAPNGPEMAGGVLIWTAASALLMDGDADLRGRRHLLWAVALGSSIVIVTHTIGSVWLVLGVAPLLAMASRFQWQATWRQLRPTIVKTGVTVVAVALLSAAWTVTQGANLTGSAGPKPPPLAFGDVVRQAGVWARQMIGMVPYRNESAPAVAYVLGFATLAAIVIVGAARGGRRLRIALAIIAGELVVANIAFGVGGYPKLGWAWQGRYALPLAYGLLVLPAWELDRWVPRRKSGRLAHRWTPAIAAMLVGAVNAITLLNVFVNEEGPWWSRLDHVPEPSRVVVALTCLTGTVLLTVATLPARRPTDPDRRHVLTEHA